ncbi:MAG: DUF423 domain-containing protein [Flavobacteriaceae bacterium]|nr:DUF423 domain-containing protein [Mangrovimonas sp.]MCB0436383.1 DUF423 domain-containing protein [Mangrovimonas sp.]MCB0469597.1 DUF423 domain-containing protein [Flavobacteriaceae bacterium]HRV56219.1 DUF423 domain-containing protein [Mangrovimonas sp.]
MNRTILITGAILGMLSVILGAYGAHGLKQLVSMELVQTFETGVKYQMYHALLLLFLGTVSVVPYKLKRAVFALTLIGVIFFSGSIYGLVTNEYTAFDFKKIALITPVGGTFLIAAWGVLLVAFLRTNKQ